MHTESFPCLHSIQDMPNSLVGKEHAGRVSPFFNGERNALAALRAGVVVVVVVVVLLLLANLVKDGMVGWVRLMTKKFLVHLLSGLELLTFFLFNGKYLFLALYPLSHIYIYIYTFSFYLFVSLIISQLQIKIIALSLLRYPSVLKEWD